MKDFGYCVWYIPWKMARGIDLQMALHPHVTIKHSLSYSDALRLYLAIDPKTIEVQLDSAQVTVEEDFWALFYNLKPIENKPDWYPKDPHISFYISIMNQ